MASEDSREGGQSRWHPRRGGLRRQLLRAAPRQTRQERHLWHLDGGWSTETTKDPQF